MDIGSMIVMGGPLALLVATFYVRPASRVELAHLARAADGSRRAMQIVERLLLNRYVMYWQYEQTLQRVREVTGREDADMVLAPIEARIRRPEGRE